VVSAVNRPLSELAQSSVVHLGVAFLAMGGWAAFANRAHPMPAPLLAGLVQGAISAAITLCLKRSIEFLASRFRGIAALLAPPAIAAIISASLLTAIHTIAGTPEIAHTIAVPLAVSTSYAALYSFSLWRLAKAHT
jgi:mannose/fructose/N-acetylgalactosamine-specific phosphotransferase system component IIC